MSNNAWMNTFWAGFLLLVLLGGLQGCATEEGTNLVSEGRMTLPDVPGQWTYVNLSRGRVVGTCALNDTASQRQWAERTDWDLATCQGMLRTNGGASGSGRGGAALVSLPFDEVDATHPAAYQQDCDTVLVW